MTLAINNTLSNIFAGVADNEAPNKKVVISNNGAVAENNESRGIFSWYQNKHHTGASAVINDLTQKSIAVLRNALTDSIGAKGAQLFNQYISARKISGHQRLTMQDLKNLKTAVNQYVASVNNNSRQFFSRADISGLSGSNGRADGCFMRAGNEFHRERSRLLSGMSREGGILSEQLSRAGSLLESIPREFSNEVFGKNYGLSDLKIVITSLIDKCAKAQQDLRTITSNLAARPECSIEAEVAGNCRDILCPKFAACIDHLNKKLAECELALKNKGDSCANVRDAFNDKIDAAIKTINGVKAKIARKLQDRNSLNRASERKCQTAMAKLDALSREYAAKKQEFAALNLRDDDTVPTGYLKFFKKLQGKCAEKINSAVSDLGIADLKTTDAAILNEFSNTLGKKAWSTISRDMKLTVDGQEKIFNSTMTPVKELNPGLYEDGVNGIPSGNRLSEHVSNLFKTELRDENGQKLFTGYRHAVLDAAGEKNDNLREQKARQRARELITTIVMDRFADDIGSDDPLKGGKTQDHPIEFTLSSVNLLNPISYFGNEKKMTDNQLNALRALMPQNNGGNQEPVRLRIGDRDVWIKPKIRAFNTPANKWSSGSVLGKYFWKQAEEQTGNRAAISDMFGQNFLNTRVSLNELANSANEETVYSRFVSSLDPDSDVGRFMSDPRRSAAEKKNVFMLSLEINLIMNNALFRDPSFDAFELPARLALLNDMLGNVTCFNCKSGKDRTGHLDVVAKQLAVKMNSFAGGNALEFMSNKCSIVRKLSGKSYATKDDAQNFTRLAAESGNLEVQQLNCGMKGSKVNKVSGIVEHFGGSNVFKFYTGAAKFAKS